MNKTAATESQSSLTRSILEKRRKKQTIAVEETSEKKLGSLFDAIVLDDEELGKIGEIKKEEEGSANKIKPNKKRNRKEKKIAAEEKKIKKVKNNKKKNDESIEVKVVEGNKYKPSFGESLLEEEKVVIDPSEVVCSKCFFQIKIKEFSSEEYENFLILKGKYEIELQKKIVYGKKYIFEIKKNLKQKSGNK